MATSNENKMLWFHFPQHLRKAQTENTAGSKDCLEGTATGPSSIKMRKPNGMVILEESLTVKRSWKLSPHINWRIGIYSSLFIVARLGSKHDVLQEVNCSTFRQRITGSTWKQGAIKPRTDLKESKCILLSDRSQSEKATHCRIPIPWPSGKGGTWDRVERSVLSGD